MNDEARIARLTELARRVYPLAEPYVFLGQTHGSVVLLADEGDFDSELVVIEHPEEGCTDRLLDALEAALLVLADEDRVPLTERQVLEDRIKAAERDRESILRRYKELQGKAEAPAWVEKLASEWEQREAELGSYARDPVVSQKGQTYGVCARELRARAKP